MLNTSHSFIELANAKVLVSKQQKIIQKEISDRQIEISWNLNLPSSSQLLHLSILTRMNQNEIYLASRGSTTKTMIMHGDDLPPQFQNRITPIENGIIINQLIFEVDHSRSFYASVIYIHKNHTWREKSEEVTLVIRYPPEFINFSPKSNILENAEGVVVCLVRSFPEIMNIKWELEGIPFPNNKEYPIMTKDLKLKYGIMSDSRLFYSIAILRYNNVKRNYTGSLSCKVTNDMGFEQIETTHLNVLYAPLAPDSLETETVTDSEAMVKWKGPSPNTGNPNRILHYKVEFLPHDTKVSNNIKSRNNLANFNAHQSQDVMLHTNQREIEWLSYNTSSEEVTLYNLHPNSLYLVRVKAFNGATYSLPSPEVSFKTQQSKYTAPSKWSITQPILIAIITSAAFFSLIIMFMATSCFIRMRRKNQRNWAILNRSAHIFNQDIKNLDEVSEKCSDYQKGFGSLPPPHIDPKDFHYFNSSSNFPNLDKDSISIKNSSRKEDTTSYCSNISKPDVQTQIATRYIGPSVNSSINQIIREPSRTVRTNSQSTVCTNKTAYV